MKPLYAKTTTINTPDNESRHRFSGNTTVGLDELPKVLFFSPFQSRKLLKLLSLLPNLTFDLLIDEICSYISIMKLFFLLQSVFIT